MFVPRPLDALFSTIVLTIALLIPGVALQAQEAEAVLPAEEAAPAEPDWSFELGLSYLATSGNSDTSSGGVSAQWLKDWAPWSLEAKAFLLRAEDDGDTTAERYGASLAGARALNETWDLTSGWSVEKDRFSGIDLRHVLNAGVSWHIITEENWTLSSLLGLTWTSEDVGGGMPSNNYLGALAGLDSKWILSETAEVFTKLIFYPNFDQSDDYRLEGKVGLTASLTSRLALQLGYEVRYDNRPVAGFEKTDTATTASLVVKLPGPAAN